ncbi:hypothetical protein [Burkholderia ubonensis]|uniref:hypothetical protein n=1 Tax=Burkholderia ubonensis TaxID=101571 RepID=UPI00075A5151|nr:hypothetical protein [Burkholderia ubonensis]KVV44934.1 hypothetical protein WK81_00025 [Burkholderia ubonensis]KVW35953.1 hypothetical protein WK95_23995 [Burkholderia ubonensis]
MRYKKEFFDLQIRFAQIVVALTDIPIEKALLDYTNIYMRFALGRAFDQDHPVWRCYADGLNESADLADWTYRFYLARADVIERRPIVATVGCFSYAMQDAGCVRIHFENIEPPAVSPLSINRLPVRHAELRVLFDHVRRNQRQATHVAGTSWLYNLSAYQRCFPSAYVASAKIAKSRFRNMPLWGQFLDRHGAVRASVADEFIRRLPDVANLQDLMCSFPLQALAVQAPIEQFYRFYGA